MSPSSGDLSVVEAPERSYAIPFLNFKIAKIGKLWNAFDDLCYLSVCHSCQIVQTNPRSATHLSICLDMCMGARFLGICAWFDIHILLCMSVSICIRHIKCLSNDSSYSVSITLKVMSGSTTEWDDRTSHPLPPTY